MRHPKLLLPDQAALVIVDMQEAFRPAIAEFDAIARRIAIVAQGAQLLSVPILITEQSPQKLGRTAKEIQASSPLEKTAFSCCGAPGFLEQLQGRGAKQILLCGIEAHVCVSQTAHDLLAAGLQVHLLTDCISSRNAGDKATGLQKMLQSGAIPSSVEMALFELMQDARHEQFRAIQKLIK
jgi:nicotinamidase-related amidase